MVKGKNQQHEYQRFCEDNGRNILMWGELAWENCKYLIHIILWWCVIILSLSALGVKSLVDFGYEKVLACNAMYLESTEHLVKKYERCREIMDRKNEKPYLLRYYLLFTDRVKFPFNIFLHKFLQDDDDEDVHDHPWGFFHLIISGGYWEEVPVNKNGNLSEGTHKIWRKAGYWNIVGLDYKHRIELGETKPWTIFIPFKKRNNWGFWVNDKETTEWKKISHDKYLGEREQKQTRTGLRVRKKIG